MMIHGKHLNGLIRPLLAGVAIVALLMPPQARAQELSQGEGFNKGGRTASSS
jgi:hypothetical protein